MLLKRKQTNNVKKCKIKITYLNSSPSMCYIYFAEKAISRAVLFNIFYSLFSSVFKKLF